MLKRLWCEDEGVLTLEWIILTTFIVIGVIGGLAAVRDALVHELAGVVGAISALDQSYSTSWPIGISVSDGSAGGCSTSVAGSKMAFLDSSSYGSSRITTTYGQNNNQVCTVAP